MNVLVPSAAATSATSGSLTVVPMTPTIGAEIRGIDLRDELAPATVQAIHQAWLDHVILVFRGQDLSQETLLRVTTYFGTVGKLSRPAEYFPAGYARLLPNIMLISNIRENGQPIGALPDGEMMFHHDMIHAEMPHNGTLLFSVEIPDHGGNTLFANGYAAYDTLDPALRARLEGRRAQHHYSYGSTQKGDNRGTPASARSTHPIFRTHDETGRKAVYVNRLMTVGIEGMDDAESAPLLATLFDHAERPDFVYEHVWQKGDLIIWDNRCSSHARRDFPADQRRLMLRTTVVGTKRPY